MKKKKTLFVVLLRAIVVTIVVANSAGIVFAQGACDKVETEKCLDKQNEKESFWKRSWALIASIFGRKEKEEVYPKLTAPEGKRDGLKAKTTEIYSFVEGIDRRCREIVVDGYEFDATTQREVDEGLQDIAIAKEKLRLLNESLKRRVALGNINAVEVRLSELVEEVKRKLGEFYGNINNFVEDRLLLQETKSKDGMQRTEMGPLKAEEDLQEKLKVFEEFMISSCSTLEANQKELIKANINRVEDRIVGLNNTIDVTKQELSEKMKAVSSLRSGAVTRDVVKKDLALIEQKLVGLNDLISVVQKKLVEKIAFFFKLTQKGVTKEEMEEPLRKLKHKLQRLNASVYVIQNELRGKMIALEESTKGVVKKGEIEGQLKALGQNLLGMNSSIDEIQRELGEKVAFFFRPTQGVVTKEKMKEQLKGFEQKLQRLNNSVDVTQKELGEKIASIANIVKRIEVDGEMDGQLKMLEQKLQILNSSVDVAQKELKEKSAVFSELGKGISTKKEMEEQLKVVEEELRNVKRSVDSTQKELSGKVFTLSELTRGAATKGEVEKQLNIVERQLASMNSLIESTRPILKKEELEAAQRKLSATMIDFAEISNRLQSQIVSMEEKSKTQFDALLSTTEALIKKEVGERFGFLEKKFKDLNEKLQRVEKLYAKKRIAPSVSVKKTVNESAEKEEIARLVRESVKKQLYVAKENVRRYRGRRRPSRYDYYEDDY